MSFFGTLTEGGQTWAHRFRMLRQVFKLTSTISFVIGLLIFMCLLLDKPLFLYQSAWYYLKATTLGLIFDHILVNSDFWEKIANERYASIYPSIPSNKVEYFTELC